MNCTLASDQIFQMCYKPTLETFANVHAEQMFVFVNQLFLLIPFLGHTVLYTSTRKYMHAYFCLKIKYSTVDIRNKYNKAFLLSGKISSAKTHIKRDNPTRKAYQ